jgi:hypothetical protein
MILFKSKQLTLVLIVFITIVLNAAFLRENSLVDSYVKYHISTTNQHPQSDFVYGHIYELHNGSLPAPEASSQQENESFSACLIVMDENFRLPEWIAYHYHVLPLRHLIVAVDPRSNDRNPALLASFQRILTIQLWQESDFMSKAAIQRNKRFDLYRQHLRRQSAFLGACLEHLQKLNKTWTALWDTDEFITYNGYNTSRPIHAPITTPTDMATSGSILRYLRDWGQDHCVVLQRNLVGNQEENLNQTKFPLNPRRFDTLRYLYAAPLRRSRINGAHKSMVNARHLPADNQVPNCHLPVPGICPPFDGPHVREGPFVLRHYVGSWEAYSYRNDSRVRNYQSYLERANITDRHLGKELEPWLAGFFNSIGHDLATELLQNAGLVDSPKPSLPQGGAQVCPDCVLEQQRGLQADDSLQGLETKSTSLSLVVQLEEDSLANLGYGFALQYILETKYNITISLLLRHQELRWQRYETRIKACFPKLANLSFEAANNELFEELLAQLQRQTDLKRVFQVSQSNDLMTQLDQLHRTLLHDGYRSMSPFGGNVSISFPFVYLGPDAEIKVAADFRPKFDSLFETTKCFSKREWLWEKIVLSPAVQRSDEPLGYLGNPVTIVIQLNGEMGNHLSKLAYGYGLQWMLKEDYNISAHTLLRHQDSFKWSRVKGSFRECFPRLRTLNFSAANTAEFNARLEQQKTNLPELLMGGLETEADIRKGLDALVRALNSPTMPFSRNAMISAPFLLANTLGLYGYINDRYYEQLRGLFEFDFNNPTCCGADRVMANETVLHVRAFSGELHSGTKGLGFEELSPNKTVRELLRERLPGENVAVLSRFPKISKDYVDALLLAGLNARQIETSTGDQSFCFLLSARQEMIGNAISTFAVWGAYLGNAKRARLYSLKSPERLQRFGQSGFFHHFNFTNPLLKRRMSFETYTSEAQDEAQQRTD